MLPNANIVEFRRFNSGAHPRRYAILREDGGASAVMVTDEHGNGMHIVCRLTTSATSSDWENRIVRALEALDAAELAAKAAAVPQ